MATVEKYIEKKFVEWCEKNGAKAVKGPTANSKGFPDRIVVLPRNGGTIYVEFKGDGYYDLTPTQKWWKALIESSSPNRYFKVSSNKRLVVETVQFIHIAN